MENKKCPLAGKACTSSDCSRCAIGGELDKLHRKIGRLEQELAEAKREGEWVGIEYDGYADGLPVFDLWECSACGNEWRGDEPPCFCPDCGAKMKTE